LSWLFVLPPLYNLYKLFLLWWLLGVKDLSSWLKKHLHLKRCIFSKCHAHLGHFHWEHCPKKRRTILLEPNVRKAFQVVKSMKLMSLFFKFNKAFCIALKFVYNIDALFFVVVFIVANGGDKSHDCKLKHLPTLFNFIIKRIKWLYKMGYCLLSHYLLSFFWIANSYLVW